MSKRKTLPRVWIGWREWVDLPALEIAGIKAKIDTGAATSAIHAIHIRRFTEDGRRRVAFEIHPEQRSTAVTIACQADIHDERYVTSSTGHREKRIVIRTPVRIANQQWPIDLTLTNRDTMGFRMLLGRRAMHGHVLVDPSASYLAGAADSGGKAADGRARRRG
ncbi:ATP-dependent zinc protease [Ectothiorhodospiraceae bacterium WFHF3C12]|nr:ATP-dependent zinc protease [Ectothiorhodospiraceae bacterium WFHF3C12]